MTDGEPIAPELPNAYADGELVPVDMPAVYDDEPEAQAGRTWGDVLNLLIAATTTPLEIGNRALFLGYIMRTPSAPRNLRELGARMGISHVMARKRLTTFKADLRAIMEENGIEG